MKFNAELLSRRLVLGNLLDNSCRSTAVKKRHERFLKAYCFFKDNLCFCNDPDNLFQELGVSNGPNEWRLFIDSFSRNGKTISREMGQ